MTGELGSFIVLAEMAVDTLKISIRCRILWKRFGAAAVVTVLVCLGIGLRLANLHNTRGRTPDESIYTKQANVLLQSGSAGLRELVEEYQRDPTARLFPPPTRIGYLWMLAATLRLSGKTDESAGAYLSCAASIGSLVLVALIGFRFFPPWATVFALLFLAVSPAELELARRTWSDALVGFLALSLFGVSAQITRDSQRPLWYVLFVLLGGFGVLVKESWPVVLGLCTVWVLWVLLFELKAWKNALILMAGGVAGMAGCVAWLASSIGGLRVVAGILPNLIHANAANPYALEYQSGPGYYLYLAFWVLTPFTAALCPLGLAVVFFSRSKRNLWRGGTGAADWEVVFWSGLLLIFFFAIPIVLPHWLNLRYLSPVLGLFCLQAGVGIWFCISHGLKRFGTLGQIGIAALTITVAAAAARNDYQRFQTMFVRNEVGDLSIKLVLDPRSLANPVQ